MSFKINTIGSDGSNLHIVKDFGSQSISPFEFALSGDGTTVVYSIGTGVLALGTDGSSPITLEPQDGFSQTIPTISYDGSIISYTRFHGSVGDVFLIDRDGNRRMNVTNIPMGVDSRGFPLSAFVSSLSANGSTMAFFSTADLAGGQNVGHFLQAFVAHLGETVPLPVTTSSPPLLTAASKPKR